MAAPEDPAVGFARIDGRLDGVDRQLGEIKTAMATKEGSQALVDLVVRLERALDLERTERIASIAKVEARLQLVEDRLEARKFQFLIAMAVGALGIVFGLVRDSIFGGP